jgi:hypothetical protein
LQEHSRQAKRIHLADLRPKPHTAVQLQQQAAGAKTSLLMPSSGTLQQQQQQQQSGAVQCSAAAAAAAAGGRKLVIPAPAFIPLEAPEELVKAAAEASGGNTAAAAAAAGAGLGFGDALGFGSAAAVKKIEPEVLVEQVGFSRKVFLWVDDKSGLQLRGAVSCCVISARGWCSLQLWRHCKCKSRFTRKHFASLSAPCLKHATPAT